MRAVTIVLFFLYSLSLWAAGPGLEQVDPSAIDLSKDSEQQLPEVDARFADFDTEAPHVGDLAPDFTLTAVDGSQVKLSSFRSVSPVLVVFGSASCFVYRRYDMRTVDQWRHKYAPRLAVLGVYTLEAHPALDPSPYTGHQWTSAPNVQDRVLVRQPRNYDERFANARALVARFGLDGSGILVDGFDNGVWKTYGGLPNDAYLIGIDGKVVYKESWTLQTPGRTPGHFALVDAIDALVGAN